ncbi:MAG TPA: MFS transporter [Polyangia bacterium]|jgi:predicted MFS family arabinose efflux permease|nr:MFS transporter [Polyangia bacterium]
MSLAEAAPGPAPTPAPARRRGVPPLPLLTLVNGFNYLDRQVVYGMTPLIGDTFGLSKTQLGLLATVNLVVFAVASLVSGPVADRIGARKVIFSGILVWSIATIGSALSGSYHTLLFFRALVGVGEGAYGPSANALLCADAPPEKRGRAMGIYNVGMALGGTLGLCLGALLAPKIGWRNVFWLAGGPSMLLALASAFVASPDRIERPTKLPAWAYLLKPTYILALLGGIMATFGASALIFWTRWLVIEVRQLSVFVGSVYMLFVGLVCGVGGVIVGGYAGDRLNRRAPGGHALAIGISMLLAVPFGTAALFVTPKIPFMILTAAAAFLLSVYNGPSAAVVDELGPPQFSATLQAVFLFGIHVLGNAPAPTFVGTLADHMPLPVALVTAVVAFGLSGVLFCIVARRQRRAAETELSSSPA